MADDPELDAIRARMRAEIVQQATAPPKTSNPSTTVLDAPVDVHEGTFEAFVRQHRLVIVDLWAPWCGPCRFVAPVLEEIARTHSGRVAIAKVNVDEEPALSAHFGVRSIPTLLLFKAGRMVDRVVGALPKPQLEAWLRPHLG